MSYRIFEHTADLGIEATGGDAGECLSAAGQALAEIVTGRSDRHTVRPTGEAVFRVEAPDLPALAVAFLSELLWLLESENLLWLGGGADVQQIQDGWSADVAGNAAVYDVGLHGIGTEVKAVTYHGLRFGGKDGRWRLRVILDI